MRGIWLTNTDSTLLHSRENLRRGLTLLKSLGFDLVYPTVWHRGYTLYPSAVAARHTGHPVLPQREYQGRDYLAELIEIAQDLEIRVVAWWEYGLMLPPQCGLVERYPDRLTLTNTGDRLRRKAANAQLDSCVWLNPCDPAVGAMMTELLLDLVERYPLAGVQFDDHWAWPVELGFDPATQAFYRQSQGGIWPWGQRTSWADWSMQQMTALSQQVFGALSGPISLAPNPLRFAQQNYRQDWLQWLDWLDEVVLQVYRYDLTSFQGEIAKPELQPLKTKTSIGILTGLRGRPQPLPLVQQQTVAAQMAGYRGCSYFFYETAVGESLRELWPSLDSNLDFRD